MLRSMLEGPPEAHGRRTGRNIDSVSAMQSAPVLQALRGLFGHMQRVHLQSVFRNIHLQRLQ